MPKARKCIVKGCPNRTSEGVFKGDICMACYQHLRSGVIGPTESFLKCIPWMRKKLIEVKTVAFTPGDSADYVLGKIQGLLDEVEDDGE